MIQQGHEGVHVALDGRRFHPARPTQPLGFLHDLMARHVEFRLSLPVPRGHPGFEQLGKPVEMVLPDVGHSLETGQVHEQRDGFELLLFGVFLSGRPPDHPDGSPCNVIAETALDDNILCGPIELLILRLQARSFELREDCGPGHLTLDQGDARCKD